MKIITTPMCEDVLKIANVNNYSVVKINELFNADLAITLSETKTEIPQIAIKLNTYTQLLESIKIISNKLNTKPDENIISQIESLNYKNKQKIDNRRNTKVKVYSKFLYDTVEDMGFTISEDEYEFVIIPDYMEGKIDYDKTIITIPSHSNVTSNIIERLTNRYQLLESKLCMKQ